VADPAWLAADSVTLALQVNGKRRGEIELPAGSDEALVRERALADEAVVRAMAGKAPRRVIVVPDRIVNVVV
jgi:leucyl-tRNA synthetase